MKNLTTLGKIFLVLVLTVMLFSTSCQGKKEPKPDLVVWSGFTEAELKVLKERAAQFNKENNLRVSVINVPYNELKIKYQVAAPAGQGPDLITGPNDWVGPFAIADLVSPLNESEFSKEQKEIYNKVSLDAMTYNEEIYGIPFSMETIAIIYNKKLVDHEPQTMDELLQMAEGFNDNEKGKYGFFFEIGNMYFSWPFLSGFGAKIFGETDGKMDVNKIALDSPQTLEGIQYLSDMRNKYKLIPDGATTDMMNGIFFNDNMMFCLNGPWMMGDLKKNNFDFGVMPLPPLPNGKRPSPFVGVQGILLNKMCKNRELAVRFMHYVNKPDNQKMLSLATGRVPSRKDTLELIQDQKEILIFAEAASYGTPMPNHPAIGQVWGPIGELLKLVIIDKKDPKKVLQVQVKRIKSDIQRMME